MSSKNLRTMEDASNNLKASFEKNASDSVLLVGFVSDIFGTDKNAAHGTFMGNPMTIGLAISRILAKYPELMVAFEAAIITAKASIDGFEKYGDNSHDIVDSILKQNTMNGRPSNSKPEDEPITSERKTGKIIPDAMKNLRTAFEENSNVENGDVLLSFASSKGKMTATVQSASSRNLALGLSRAMDKMPELKRAVLVVAQAHGLAVDLADPNVSGEDLVDQMQKGINMIRSALGRSGKVPF